MKLRRRDLRIGAAAVSLLLLVACKKDDPNPPPALSTPEITEFSVSPTELVVGESAIYSWEVSESSAVCALDIGGDGTAEYTLGCDVGSQTHTFTAAGSFPATLNLSAVNKRAAEPRRSSLPKTKRTRTLPLAISRGGLSNP